MKLTTKIVQVFEPNATPRGTQVKVECELFVACYCCLPYERRKLFSGTSYGVINWTTENEVEVLINGHEYNFTADDVAEGIVTITRVAP